MGGELDARTANAAPTFLLSALKDPDGANLDRMQVIKGWIDEHGVSQEKVYDVAWSNNRQPGADGKLPSLPSTVEAPTAQWTNQFGSAALTTYWQDPAFDRNQAAFYYVRVLEISTPRWTTYDAVYFEQSLPNDVPAEIQQRAYSSPIWYTP
jgi:hypothetical protein